MRTTLRLLLCVFISIFAVSNPARAGVVLDIYYDQVKPGQLVMPAADDQIWLKAEFSTYNPMQTLLTLTASGLVSTEFASTFEFNFESQNALYKSSDILNGLTITAFNTDGLFALDKNEDGINPGKFDFSITPDTRSSSAGTQRLTSSATWQFLLSSSITTYTTSQVAAYNKKGVFTGYQTVTTPHTTAVAVSPLDFNSLNEAGYWSLAHIQGIIGSPYGTSTWAIGTDDPPVITASTPEPSTMLLLGAGAAGTAFMKRRRNTSKV